MSKLTPHEDSYAYISSNGRETPIGEMAYTHLKNAIAKIEKGEHDPVELNILKKELATRPAPEE